MARHPVRNCKCYTLSVLAASLAVSAAVSIVLIDEMSPAHIYFSIVKATHNTSSNGGLELSIALAANNSSPRASALYQSIYIGFCNKNNTGAVTCIGTDVVPMPLSQKMSSELIHETVVLEGADSPWVTLGVMPSQERFIGNKSFDSIWVNVSAVVRFKRPGIHRTSLHDINVSCGSVTFISQANQSSAGIRHEEFNCN
ncbi:unnamed protein product [Urochloa humidicola]